MTKIDLFKEMVKFNLEKSTFPDTTTPGIPNLNTIELKLIVEIIPEDYFYSTNKEFFIISTFETIKKESEDPELVDLKNGSSAFVLNNEPVKKWIFHKILFMNKNIEDIFEKYDMNKTEIIPIKHSNEEIKVSQIFIRHLSSVLRGTVKYRILLDELNFNTFFITKEIEEFKKVE